MVAGTLVSGFSATLTVRENRVDAEVTVSDQEKLSAVDASDTVVTIENLKAEMLQFVAERDWQQFHSPKNLSMSIAIEAAELMEHFQWLDQDQSRQLDKSSTQHVGEELADVLCYALAMANELGLDIATTVRAKMEKNRSKYPADTFRGRYGQRDLDRQGKA